MPHKLGRHCGGLDLVYNSVTVRISTDPHESLLTEGGPNPDLKGFGPPAYRSTIGSGLSYEATPTLRLD
jgi:hypothetical protein